MARKKLKPISIRRTPQSGGINVEEKSSVNAAGDIIGRDRITRGNENTQYSCINVTIVVAAVVVCGVIGYFTPFYSQITGLIFPTPAFPSKTPIPTRILTPISIATLQTSTPIVVSTIPPPTSTFTSTPRPPTPTLTLTPTRPQPIPTQCTVRLADTAIFRNLWSKYNTELGCPQTEVQLGSDTIKFNEQPFEKGHMFFVGSDPVNFVVVKYDITKSDVAGRGTWQQFPSQPWTGKDENFCPQGEGLFRPIYDNFNKVWCSNATVRNQLGSPTDYDALKRRQLSGANDVQSVLAQSFENGFILRDSVGASTRTAYIFLNNATYIRDFY